MNIVVKTAIAVAALASAAIQTNAAIGVPQMNNSIVSNQSVSLNVHRTGQASGNNVVFLHGDSGAASQWFGVMKELADSHSLTAFDQRGHGSSSPVLASDYSYEDRADDLRAVIAALGLQSVVLVAHSGSAGVALAYAAKNAETLRGIYFLDPASDPRRLPGEMRQEFLDAIESEKGLIVVQGYFASIAGQNPETIATVTGDAAQVAPDARIGFARSLMGWNPQAAMAHWAGPAYMAITSANDTGAAIHHFNESIGHEILPSDGHWPHLDNPQIVAQSIRSFINGLP